MKIKLKDIELGGIVMWLKIWRDSSAMAGRPHYAEYKTEGDMKILLERYDDMIHGDGYHGLKWEKINSPPKEWIKKEIKKYREKDKNLYKEYRKTKIAIKEIIKKYEGISLEL